jgi:hypothetical protein
VRGRARRAFSMLSVRPSCIMPCRPSLAASAASAVTILTKPKPRESPECGSLMMLDFSTSPYFSNSWVTSASERRGWMPVTKRFVPGLRETSSSLPSGAELRGQRMQPAQGGMPTGYRRGRGRWGRRCGRGTRRRRACHREGSATHRDGRSGCRLKSQTRREVGLAAYPRSRGCRPRSRLYSLLLALWGGDEGVVFWARGGSRQVQKRHVKHEGFSRTGSKE